MSLFNDLCGIANRAAHVHRMNAAQEPEPPAKCPHCHGKGWNDEWHDVAGHYEGGEVFRVECDACEGSGEQQ